MKRSRLPIAVACLWLSSCADPPAQRSGGDAGGSGLGDAGGLVGEGEGEGEGASEGEGEGASEGEGEGEGERPPPAPDPVVCAAGDRRCVGESVEGCNEDGTAWVFAQACPTACVAGACLDAACAPGARRCSGPVVEECAVRGLSWQAVVACEAGCTDGVCDAPGDPGPPDPPDPPEPVVICEPELQRCAGDSVEVCSDEGVAWVVREVCAVACQAGACLDAACAAGERRCSGDEVEVCSDDRRGWRFRRDCPAGCEAGECLDPVCAAFARRCDGDIPEVCDARGGAWIAGPACPDGCVDGGCAPPPPGACEPGLARCDGLDREECADDGQWRSEGPCEQACVGGQCVQCAPGLARCSGDAVEVCRPDGQGYDADAPCAVGCNDGRCLACEPGARRCDGDAVQGCDEAGRGWTPVSACETACRGGACTPCRPGALRCGGVTVERCAEEGIGWEPVLDCAARCEGGACVCDPDGPEVPGNGEDDDCDGEIDEAPGLTVLGFEVVGDAWDGEAPVTYGGAGNGLVDAGERVLLRLRVRNTVGVRLLGGDATLRAAALGAAVDPDTATGEYDAMAPGDEAVVDHLYVLTVSPDLADGTPLSLTVVFVDSLLGELGGGGFSTVVHRVGRFDPVGVVIDDDLVGYSDGDDDGRGDAGEEVEMRFSMQAGAALPLAARPDDANERVLPPPPHLLRVTAEALPPWMALEGPDLDQTWDAARPDSPLDPPATLFLALADDAPDSGLSCVRVVQTVHAGGEVLYRFAVPTCFRISAACSADDGDGDGVPCLFGDCLDEDAGRGFTEEETACDGLDDDCDGRVDDPWGVGDPCDGEGVCVGGTVECAGADAGICSVVPGGSEDRSGAEECDELDNDCDGAVDEDAGCRPESCGPGVDTLSIAPGRDMMLCHDPREGTCEQDFEDLCPGNWHLCTPAEFRARNDGWSAPRQVGQALGLIRCRGANSDAGHYTVGSVGSDAGDNCDYGSSRPSCPAGYGCNELSNSALCCEPLPSCGNGVVDHPQEGCDDGNDDDTDACLNVCYRRRC